MNNPVQLERTGADRTARNRIPSHYHSDKEPSANFDYDKGQNDVLDKHSNVYPGDSYMLKYIH